MFPTNGKVALVADVDGDGVKELIIASTDRVVRVFKWVKEEIQKGVCDMESLMQLEMCTSYSKSAAGLLSCSHQADIRIHMHRML